MALEDFCSFWLDDHILRGPAPLLRPPGITAPRRPGLGTSGKSNHDNGPPLHFLVPPAAPSPRHRRRLAPSVVRRPFPLTHGTTTLAFVFRGGVIAAADTRASAGGLVACPSASKIIPVHSHLVVTTSGSGADCMLWARVLEREIRLYGLRHGRRLSVRGTAKLLAFMLHPFKGTDVCVALTLCGWDQGGKGDGGDPGSAGSPGDAPSHMTQSPVSERSSYSSSFSSSFTSSSSSSSSSSSTSPSSLSPSTSTSSSTSSTSSSPYSASSSAGVGPKVIYVCSDGARLQGQLFSVGSGSPYAYGILDGGLRWTLSPGEAASLAREAVFRATHRDAYSGNNVDLVRITEGGWSRREREDLKEEYHRWKEAVGKTVEERRRMTD
ncbi:unnamed protein product [Merluccius merluccius]